MIAVTCFQQAASSSICKKASSAGFFIQFLCRLFGFPFFEADAGSEILRMNRKFTNEFDAIAQIKQELKNPYSKISKEGKNAML